MKKHKLLIIGATGMLGFSIYRYLVTNPNYDIYVGFREKTDSFLFSRIEKRKVNLFDALNHQSTVDMIDSINPNIVINCTGLVKQLDLKNNVFAIVKL